jgi:hypothetical protein
VPHSETVLQKPQSIAFPGVYGPDLDVKNTKAYRPRPRLRLVHHQIPLLTRKPLKLRIQVATHPLLTVPPPGPHIRGSKIKWNALFVSPSLSKATGSEYYHVITSSIWTKSIHGLSNAKNWFVCSNPPYHIQFLTYLFSALFVKPTSLNISHL